MAAEAWTVTIIIVVVAVVIAIVAYMIYLDHRPWKKKPWAIDMKQAEAFVAVCSATHPVRSGSRLRQRV